MHDPAILNCSHLDMRDIRFTLTPADVVEWLEHEPEKEWDEPRQLDLREGIHTGSLAGVVDALKEAFLSATTRKPYVLRISSMTGINHVNETLSNAVREQLRIRFRQHRWMHESDLVVKRK
ncbi:hypothetical protein AAVH_34996 [Aphelenchoides avenae]|nr:hypothetical protein AAVH_34996 [Aphelenchus avenae]